MHARIARQLLVAAIAIAFLAGCASAPQQTALMQEGVAVDDQLSALPGVESTTVTPNPGLKTIDVIVQVTKNVTVNELEAIGQAVAAFRQQELPSGMFPGSVELRQGSSTYSYFSVRSEDELAEQLAYWHALTNLGFTNLSVRTYSPPYSNETALAATGAAGRFIMLDLTGGQSDGVLEKLERARAIPDPGAELGEWDVFGLAPQVKGEFAQPEFPGASDLLTISAVGKTFTSLDAHSSLTVRVDNAAMPPRVSVSLTAFERSLQKATRDSAEHVFIGTETWEHVLGTLSTLDDFGRDFVVRVTSDPLLDSGNFQLQFGVFGCTFYGDEAWPLLSDKLGERWLELRQLDDPQFVDSGECGVSPHAVGGQPFNGFG